MKLDEIYPEHFKALNKAELLENFEAPTLGVKTAELEAASKDKVGRATEQKNGEKETGREQSTSKLASATTGEPQFTRRSMKSRRGSQC